MYRLSGRSSIMAHDEQLCVSRNRRQPGCDVVYVDGKPLAREHYTFKIKCNVQPISGKDLLVVPEADRLDESMWIYQCDAYGCDAAPALDIGDIVSRCGRSWQVQSVENWQSYVKARVMAVDTGPDSPYWPNSCPDDGCGANLDAS